MLLGRGLYLRGFPCRNFFQLNGFYRIEQLEKALEEKETALKDVTRMFVPLAFI